jgi:hypothetical protein
VVNQLWQSKTMSMSPAFSRAHSPIPRPRRNLFQERIGASHTLRIPSIRPIILRKHGLIREVIIRHQRDVLSALSDPFMITFLDIVS